MSPAGRDPGRPPRNRCRRRWTRSGSSYRGRCRPLSASQAITGPRSEPPMPMLTTLRMRLPVCPFHSPPRTRVQNSAMRSSTAWTSGTTFMPSTTMEASFRRAQRHVQDRAVFRYVDLLAPEHGVDARAQARFPGQLHQQPQGLVGDPVLRIIEVDPRRLQRQSLAALRILREQRAQVHVPDLPAVAFEGLPGRGYICRLTHCCHACLLARFYRV